MISPLITVPEQGDKLSDACYGVQNKISKRVFALFEQQFDAIEFIAKCNLSLCALPSDMEIVKVKVI